MPIKSKLSQLPADLLRQLEDKLKSKDYRSYKQLSVWLKEQGYDIHQMSIVTYAKKLRQPDMAHIETLRKELKQSGIDPKCNDEKLQVLLIQLGSLRLRENILMAKIHNLNRP